MLVLLSCCSIFKDHPLPLFGGQPDYYITAAPLCQYLFESFFKYFLTFLGADRICFLFCRKLDYYTAFPFVCQGVFDDFPNIFFLYVSSAFQSAEKSDLIGVFEVGSDRDSVREPGDADAEGLQKP